MTTHGYKGRATIVAGSAEIPGYADLGKQYTQQGERWSGTLTPDDPHVDLFPLHENDAQSLQLPDGCTGNIRCDWTSIGGMTQSILIQGMGKAPF